MFWYILSLLFQLGQLPTTNNRIKMVIGKFYIFVNRLTRVFISNLMHLLKFCLLNLEWNSFLEKARIRTDLVNEYASVLSEKNIDVYDFAWLSLENLERMGISSIVHAGRIIYEGKKMHSKVIKFAFCRRDHDFFFFVIFLTILFLCIIYRSKSKITMKRRRCPADRTMWVYL